MGFAAEKNVVIHMELLNSKRNHRDYMCDRTAWGAKLVDAVGSDNFRLLYDIYHMQVQEGDCIATFREFKDHIGHYHTAGVPGRNDIDPALQELSYVPIARAICRSGFQRRFRARISAQKRSGFAGIRRQFVRGLSEFCAEKKPCKYLRGFFSAQNSVSSARNEYFYGF